MNAQTTQPEMVKPTAHKSEKELFAQKREQMDKILSKVDLVDLKASLFTASVSPCTCP